MERLLRIIAFILARIAEEKTGIDHVDILAEAEAEVDKNTHSTESADVERVYKAYPTKCPVRGAPTGKSAKNKEQIKRLLKSHSADDLIFIIERYVGECERGQVYIKNFNTFLNQLPDYSDDTDLFSGSAGGSTRKPQE